MSLRPKRNDRARECVFCGADGVTREHIFPFWLREAVGGAGAATHYRAAPAVSPPPAGTDLEYDKSWWADDAEIVVRVACATCNNTWMNDLDHAVEPIVVPLIRNHARSIGEGERTLLATWATKIALLLEHTRSVSGLTGRRALVPPVAHREFYDLRLPPTLTRLWMVRVSPPVTGTWWRTGPVPVAWLDPEGAHQLGAPNGSLTTFVTGMLGFQMLHAPLTEPYDALVRRRSELGGQFMRLLWPPSVGLAWPPPKALDATTLEVFAYLRFA